MSDVDRKRLLDALGGAFSTYRAGVYAHGFSGIGHVTHEELREFLDTALRYVDHTLHVSRRPGGLYHAYNLLDFSDDDTAATVTPLHEMLEGQVAALASGALSPIQAIDLIEALFDSKIYRPDQESFMLYPDRALPAFMGRNVVPPEAVENNPLLAALLGAGDRTVISRDADGVYRFGAGFRSAADLSGALNRALRDARFAPLVDAHRAAVMAAYEAVFRHQSFTGRSGTMYGYEGLGCIYWHMVSKLLLAVQEAYQSAEATGQPASIRATLADLYYRVRGGLGFNKTAQRYGAVPTDPYSHTPRHAGAQQPGMTGQVKEEIITRAGELGLIVDGGALQFNPTLLRACEFGPDGTLSFTLCRVPVVYRVGDAAGVVVYPRDGVPIRSDRYDLDPSLTARLISRTGDIERVELTIPRDTLRD